MWPLNVEAASAGLVTLSNATVQDIKDNSAGAAHAAVQIEADGTVTAVRDNVGDTQLFPLTDWIFPRSGDLSIYEARTTVLVGSLDGFSDPINVWIPITTALIWGVTNAATNSEISADILIEIRLGTAVLDSANYTVDAIKGTPP